MQKYETENSTQAHRLTMAEVDIGYSDIAWCYRPTLPRRATMPHCWNLHWHAPSSIHKLCFHM